MSSVVILSGSFSDTFTPSLDSSQLKKMKNWKNEKIKCDHWLMEASQLKKNEKMRRKERGIQIMFWHPATSVVFLLVIYQNTLLRSRWSLKLLPLPRPEKPWRPAPLKQKASITTHRASRCYGPTGTYMAFCLISANRHGGELLSFCFQQNRHLTTRLTHWFCGRGI